ncbi:helix-turn-helix domain-containing protein [Pluralibacter gergoviae]|uniref:helix-turn-helix domain-containing protein n=1 Tax=Pluralibacter gergoviae TaxID=61647 RepID=UPI00155DF8D0
MLKHIQDMVIFALLVKNGSYTRTASELGMTKARISQRISDLEESLGLRLLNRTTRKFSLTAPVKPIWPPAGSCSMPA